MGSTNFVKVAVFPSSILFLIFHKVRLERFDINDAFYKIFFQLKFLVVRKA